LRDADAAYDKTMSSFSSIPARRLTRRTVIALGLQASVAAMAGSVPAVDGLTFHAEPGRLWVPLDEAARELKWEIGRDATGVVTTVNGQPVPPGSLRRLIDGTPLAGVDDLHRWGAALLAGPDARTVMIQRGWREFTVVAGPQRVEISLSTQRLRAWQGGHLVLETRISSGRKRGSTPTGRFRAGPFRARMHYSSRYHRAPMPWSVQINGHIFIHGFTSVPDYPASHGCIRVPLTGGNPARFIYQWVETGTPVHVIP
jgi:lipoprotein-anchoring transpeptidase ErfK/SrfK